MSNITTTTDPLPDTTSMTDIIDPKCRNYYYNNTGILIKDFEGIPENLLINFCAWFGLLLLFTFLRKIGDYGRFGLLKNDEERRLLEPKIRRYKYGWSAKFFSKLNMDDALSTTSDLENIDETSRNQRPNDLARSNSTISQDFTHASEYKENKFFSWIVHMFKLKDKHINEKCGKDAIYYLVFQRYLIVYLFIVTIMSISILLPINLHGTLYPQRVFGSTTIVNVVPSDPVLWVHLVLSWIFFALGIIFMIQFSKRMEYSESDYVSRTVLITNYPSKHAKKEYIYKHFEEAYPELVITDVQFAYDVNKLNKLDRRKQAMSIGKITSEKIYEQTGERPLMHPFHFGSFVELCCCCCTKCCCKQENNRLTDSIEFYTKNVNHLTERINHEREKCLKKPLGILFVTFEDQSMADKFLKHYRFGLIGNIIHSSCISNKCSKCFLFQDLVKPSSLSDKINSEFWGARYAPAPNNIKWENISKYGIMWWFRCILINLILIILMIFFTTPSILMARAGSWAKIFDAQFIAKYLPVLPTVGLTSINALFEWLNNKKDEDNIKWKCVSENGAFFLKYVTTCSLIGTALDLIRLPELFLYVVRMFYSRSSAERLAVRMKAAFEFDYGVQYAWILTVFTVTLCFSVVCPLITPFGLVYLILKHLVDRYNIYFAYISTKVDKNIHKSAVKFALAAFIMLQFCILFFIALRNKGNVVSSSMTTVQLIIIILSCIIYFGSLFFGIFKRFTPFKYRKSENLRTNAQSITTESQNESPYQYINEFSDSNNEIQTVNENVQTTQPTSSDSSPSGSDTTSHSFKTVGKKAKNLILQSPFIPAIIRTSLQDPYSKLDTQSRGSKNKRSFKNQDSVLTQENIDLEVKSNTDYVQDDQETPNYGTLPKSKINENLLFQQEIEPIQGNLMNNFNSQENSKHYVNQAFMD
ncbi:unnamed protein product [Brachionus calyciflorus]|uniref:CSC1/OSCA1-like cytosolic domain-containing protein n=1 Tax=Brachionus calyciflorus TaxID=104777 RepID=A0A813Y293_9BILA|nr:unnamed protein product [Brachionus calyciflorus]